MQREDILRKSNNKFIDEFYKDFEDIYRGSEEDIKKRLKFYLPLIQSLKNTVNGKIKLLDIGCGRGEFLELVLGLDIDAEGVEINKYYVDLCTKKGLKVHYSGGLSFLKNCSDESFDVISLIQVVGHLEFSYLIELFREAYRVLKTSGFLIVETPYIKNPHVGLHYFWVDPTHTRPITQEVITFIGKSIGFEDTATFIINPLLQQEYVNLLSIEDFIYTIGGDVSVILFKDAKTKESEKIILALDKMRRESGLSYEEAINLYVKYSQTNFEFTALKLNKQIEKILELENKINTLHNTFTDKIMELENKLNTLYESKVWRFYRKLSKIKRTSKEALKNTLKYFYIKIHKNYKLVALINIFLNKFPGLKRKLKQLISGNSTTIQDGIDIMDVEEKIFLKKLKRFIGE